MTPLQLKGVIPGLAVGTSTCAYCAFSGTRIKNFENKQSLKFSLLLSDQKLQYINLKRPLFPMLGNSTQKYLVEGTGQQMEASDWNTVMYSDMPLCFMLPFGSLGDKSLSTTTSILYSQGGKAGVSGDPRALERP